ncbi:sensor histidine kinase [Sunxiuqinia sp. A32]|uniref:sensor histidine kinase n=1 Tax=Sunxiuqinia sp. A32 TaxID=3461496 RepID=UPI0040457BD7
MQEFNRLKQREPLDAVINSKATIERIEYIKEILSSLSSIICIINKSNQLVFTNDILRDKFGLDIETNILGMRPGEIFNCENADNDTGGCGTTEKCKYCGAFNAIEIAWKENKKITRECKITSVKDNITHQLDLEISATPLLFEDQYMIISIVDISEYKRKQILERIFFHDILNIAGSLSGIIQLFPQLEKDEKGEYLTIMNSLSDQIIDEIRAQQLFIKAESDGLIVDPKPIRLQTFLEEILGKMKFHQVAYDKEIAISNKVGNDTIITDLTLLSRTVVNMTKNALEAIDFKEKVIIEVEKQDDQYCISVHNNTFIPKHIQDQIFKRSFSTKGINRGVGTYSMKLLVEKYLKGKVSFISTVESGTTFYAFLPKSI